MKSVIFTDPARDEFTDAVAWYDTQQPDVADDFLVEVKRAVTRIQEHPNAWAMLAPNIRRCRLNRFPYGVIYQLVGDEILILAIAHLHRDPEYWRDRRVH